MLAELNGVDVYSIEVVPELAKRAAKRLDALGYCDIPASCCRRSAGWRQVSSHFSSTLPLQYSL